MRMRTISAVLLALAVAACAGDDDLGLEEAFQPGSNVSANAGATLTVGSDVYEWVGNDWATCTLGGAMPVWAHFQEDETTQTGNWVQFIDRGDGGINFSAVLNGEEYAGTGSGQADEITSDGLVYTGTMSHAGDLIDVRLEVTC